MIKQEIAVSKEYSSSEKSTVFLNFGRLINGISDPFANWLLSKNSECNCSGFSVRRKTQDIY